MARGERISSAIAKAENRAAVLLFCQWLLAILPGRGQRPGGIAPVWSQPLIAHCFTHAGLLVLPDGLDRFINRQFVMRLPPAQMEPSDPQVQNPTRLE
jgi:hypothetical protein